jgi:hypothetical protein
LSEKIDLKKLMIQPLDPNMDRAAFYCGEPELDDFFRDNAADHHERYLTRVYTALHDNEIVGYYWLNAQSHSSKRSRRRRSPSWSEFRSRLAYIWE